VHVIGFYYNKNQDFSQYIRVYSYNSRYFTQKRRFSVICIPILENIQKYPKISNNLDYRRQISKIASKNQEHFSKI